MCRCWSETLKTFVIGTIPYIKPATRKEYFVIAERDNNKILWAWILTVESEDIESYLVENKIDSVMAHAFNVVESMSNIEEDWHKLLDFDSVEAGDLIIYFENYFFRDNCQNISRI